MIAMFAGSTIATLGIIGPKTITSTESLSTVVDMSDVDQILATLCLGDMAAETIDFAVYSCDSDGSNAAVLKAATQLAAHATNNDNSQIVIAVKASELLASGKRYVKCRAITGGVTGGMACVLIQGVSLRYGLAADQDLASVKQIKQ